MRPVVGLTLAALLLAACAGEEAEPSPGPTATGAASVGDRSSEAPPLPTLPDAAAEQTEQGARAFVEHYFQTMNLMAQSPQPAVLDALAAPSCEPCADVADTVDVMADEQQTAEGPFAEATTLDAVLANRGAGVEAEIQWLRPSILAADGAVVAEAPGGPDGRMVLDMAFVSGSWVITSITPGALS